MQQIRPNVRTIELRGRVLDVTEMDNRQKATWASLHIEAALIRLRFKTIDETDVDAHLLELYQQASPGATIAEYLANVNGPKAHGLEGAIRALLEADDVLACMALKRASGDAMDDVARLVVDLTGSEKAALIAAQNEVNQVEQLAQAVDLGTMLAKRMVGEEN